VKLNNWGNKQDGNDKLVDITKDIKEASDKIKEKYEKINKENRELLKKINILPTILNDEEMTAEA